MQVTSRHATPPSVVRRRTLARSAAEFDEMTARRSPAAYAGDFHFNRL